MRCLAMLLALVLGGCATVTRTPNLETDAARGWLRETGDHRVRIDAPGGATEAGQIAGTTAQALRLQLADGRTVEMPVRDGTTLRERRRAPAAILGGFAGMGLGVIAGMILYNVSGVSNPDAAGGKEHMPFAVPIGVLGGALIGATAGAIVGLERRLEVGATTR